MNALLKNSEQSTVAGPLAARGADGREPSFLAQLIRLGKFSIAVMLVAAGVLGSILFLMRASLPQVQSFQYALKFVFPKAERGEYPNGTVFALTDLLAPAVLSRVHANNRLSEQGISETELTGMLSVRPFHTVSEDVSSRYRDRLADRRLTFLERQEVERAMMRELDSLKVQSAPLQLTNSRRFPIPEALGFKLLEDIASEWAKVGIEQQGVLDLPEALDGQGLVDVSLVKQADYPIAIVILSDAVGRLVRRLDRLANSGTVPLVADEKTGHTMLSLRRALADFESIRFPVLVSMHVKQDKSRSRSDVAAVFKQRRIQQDVELAALAKEIASLERALQYEGKEPRLSDSLPPGSVAVPSITEPTRRGDAGERTSAQIGDRFLERLISFIEQGLDKEGRAEVRQHQSRVREQLWKLRSRANALESDRLRDRAYMDAIVNAESKRNEVAAGGPSRDPVTAEAFEKELVVAAETLNGYWSAVVRLFALISPRHISYQGRLYAPIALGRSERYATSHPIMNWPVAAMFLAGVFGVGMATFAAGLGWRLLRNTR